MSAGAPNTVTAAPSARAGSRVRLSTRAQTRARAAQAGSRFFMMSLRTHPRKAAAPTRGGGAACTKSVLSSLSNKLIITTLRYEKQPTTC
jgi:hypothetical protein